MGGTVVTCAHALHFSGDPVPLYNNHTDYKEGKYNQVGPAELLRSGSSIMMKR